MLRYTATSANKAANLSWFENFFEGMATDIWRHSLSPEQTAAEVHFLKQHLRLAKKASVLDVPCADGRLALPLAQEGFRVTGIDLSTRGITTAKEVCAGLPAEFIQTDMRTMALKTQFDGAFCMGNSFGYFDEADTRKFFEAVSKALKPGGSFVLDTCLAAETFFTTGGSKEWVEIDGLVMLMENDYDPLTARLDSRFVFMNGGMTEEHQTHHWIFTASHICSMLADAGMPVEDLYGGLDEGPYELGSERLLIHAMKPEE